MGYSATEVIQDQSSDLPIGGREGAEVMLQGC